ncbi:MAG TPA: hypothetical protein DEO88_16045 [Syntrophobacteraceae bacterium]|nr:hypothetical protein [Syntrophobacteraceae bacterium]
MTDFELFVDDNYHYMDEESRYSAGSFATYGEALAKAKAIVDGFLENAHQPGVTSKELYEGYTGFGEDPFIVPAGEPYFSAWDYARARCRELCRDEDAVASVLRCPVWPPELADFYVVLVAALGRKELGALERKALEAFDRAIENYPNAMPRENKWYWFRLERENAAFTVYLYPDRFQIFADGTLPASVEWEIRFCGSGQRDRRLGDAARAFEAMRQAALDPASVLKAKG